MKKFVVSVDIEVEAEDANSADELVMHSLGIIVDIDKHVDVGIRKASMAYDGNAIEGEL